MVVGRAERVRAGGQHDPHAWAAIGRRSSAVAGVDDRFSKGSPGRFTNLPISFAAYLVSVLAAAAVLFARPY